jgi:hypothetical protein
MKALVDLFNGASEPERDEEPDAAPRSFDEEAETKALCEYRDALDAAGWQDSLEEDEEA